MTATTEKDNDLPQSPHAMAEAVLAAAVADRERQDKLKKSGGSTLDDNNHSNSAIRKERRAQDDSRVTTMVDGIIEDQNYDTPFLNRADQNNTQESEAEKCLNDIWKHSEAESTNRATTTEIEEEPSSCSSSASSAQKWTRNEAAEALEQTEALLKNEIDSLVRAGINAFHNCDSLSRELAQMKELAESRGREVQRLQSLEVQSRATVSNLLRAVETSKSDARDSSRTTQIEARLRGEVSTLRSERDDAIAAASESKRKASLLEEEVRLVKAKLSRVSQEKIKIERDSRAALSLARSLDSHASSDTDYYKRKVAELNDRLHAQQAHNAEQQRIMDEMKKHYERSVSQNRLAQMRAAEGGSSARGIRRDRRSK